MILLLIKLISAHLLGDFLLQPDKLCAMRYCGSAGRQICANCIHSLIQAALTYCFIADLTLWTVPAAIFISHFIIDFIKSRYGKNELPYLLLDQAAHYCVIFLIWHFLLPEAAPSGKLSQTAWIVFTAYIAVLAPTSIIVKAFMDYNSWTPTSLSFKGLPNAGRWIGFLERILILTFIFTDNTAGIGFLLAAKSVFRFGELNRSKDLKVTEYVLIGTFLSFTTAILTGYAAELLITFGKEF